MIFFLSRRQIRLLDHTFQLLQSARTERPGKWSTEGAHQGVFDQTEGKFKIAMTWQRGDGLPRAVSQHALGEHLPFGDRRIRGGGGSLRLKRTGTNSKSNVIFDVSKITHRVRVCLRFPTNVCRPTGKDHRESIFRNGIVRPTAPRRLSASRFADAGIGRKLCLRRFQPSWSCWTALASSKNQFSVEGPYYSPTLALVSVPYFKVDLER